MIKAPPRLARRLLLSFLRDDLAEEVLGDLEEKFRCALGRGSPLRAQLNYWYQVFHYMRPFAIRKGRSFSINRSDMLKSYFKIGIRNLVKSKFFSLINISGMAISMAGVFTIALFVTDEFSFDRHVPDAGDKFRVFEEQFSDDGGKRKSAMVPPMIGPTLAAEYPEVEYYARFLNFNAPPLFEVGEKKFTEGMGGCADPAIFDMFGLRLVEGNRAEALKEPNTIAINKTLKQKYFGDKPALGESIEVFDQSFKVVAVFEDCSPHSHFQRNYFLALDGLVPSERMKSWGWNQFHTYIKLKAGASADQLEAKLEDFARRNAWPETKPNGGYYVPHLMPLKKVHLFAADQLWDVAVRGNVQTVYFLMAIAGFVLIVAVLNFVNLSTARAISRVKEVGVRKVMGAFRGQLVYQFMSESVIIAMLSLVIGVSITALVVPSLNTFADKEISLAGVLHPWSLSALLLFGLFTGISAGAYPAFYISGYEPARILSNKEGPTSGRAAFRKGLVVFQFILSFFLIIASFIVSEQHRFMRTADMGFNSENLIVLGVRGDMSRDLETTKHAFSNHPNIISATAGYGLPGEAYAGDMIIDRATGKNWHINMLTVDHDYVKTLGLKIIAGRDFSKDFPSDQDDAFILSEAAAKMLGFPNPADALDHRVAWNRWDADSLKEGSVIGIVKDIQLNSMRESIAPVALQIFPSAYSTLTLRVKSQNMPATIRHLEKTWKAFNTEWPFQYRFLDENFDRLYKGEEKLAKLLAVFTTFTILVACLGLFALVVYSTSRKYREISIRKVLGAGEGRLVLALVANYLILIGIAFAISIPLSYYASEQWLERFAFRIDISLWIFVKAGLFVAGLSLLTVGIQSLRAARTNPVNALKEQ